MIAIRHTGIYVNDICRLEEFYSAVFEMIPICSMEPARGRLFDELLGIRDVEILTTKLVTPYGKTNGQGDMLELVKIQQGEKDVPFLPEDYPIFLTGVGHIAFGVDNIYETVRDIKKRNGRQKTKVVSMQNKNLCCFCRDPEGNWIELIQRYEEEDVDKLEGKTALITGGTSGIGGDNLIHHEERKNVEKSLPK